MAKLIDLTGKKFNRLLVVGRAENSKGGSARWICLCDCGKTTISAPRPLKIGRTKSCGCSRRERVSILNKSHGMTGTSVFNCWNAMKQRCYYEESKSFKNYGGRGILVCDRWLNSFDNFYLDMGDKPTKDHSIERNDTNGNYEPTNCRWATKEEQSNNCRSNVMLSYKGVTKTMTRFASEFGLSPSTVWKRLHDGWSTEKALITKVRNNTPLNPNVGVNEGMNDI